MLLRVASILSKVKPSFKLNINNAKTFSTTFVPMRDDERKAFSVSQTDEDDGKKFFIKPGTENVGLSNFISKTYQYTGIGIVCTLGISHLISSTHLFGTMEESFIPLFLGGAALTFMSTIAIDKIKHKIINDDEGLKSENPSKRVMAYGGLITGMSMTLSPMIEIVNEMSPTVVPSSFLISSLVFGSSIAYARYRPQGSLLSYQAPLFAGLVSLVGLGCISAGTQFMIGPNIFSSVLYNVDTYGGILLFTGMTAYDTQLAIDQYNKKNPDHLGCSINLYLNFMNLLVRIMQVMAESQRKR